MISEITVTKYSNTIRQESNSNKSNGYHPPHNHPQQWLHNILSSENNQMYKTLVEIRQRPPKLSEFRYPYLQIGNNEVQTVAF